MHSNQALARALKIVATPKLNRYIPHTPFPKQAAFLLLSCLEAFYGGSAGPGKSDGLLMAALQHVDEPGYAALLLRRTYKDLSKPGALMDRAHEWLDPTDAVWNGETHTWRFPSGAALVFGYLEHPGDETQYQSAEFQFVGFDELTQFSEKQYTYLFTRLRREAGSKIPLRMRSASNPGNIGHEWVKRRFITHPEGRIFIRARFTDNPYLDQNAYRASLAELDDVIRKQLEEGDWDVSQKGSVIERAWFDNQIVTRAPAHPRARIRFWDMAATERTAKQADPDWTVGTRMSEENGIFYVEHVHRDRPGPAAVTPLIEQTARADGHDTTVEWEQEGGASGKIVTAHLASKLAGWTFKGIPVHKDKVARLGPFASSAREGRVRLVEGPWISAWLDEMVAFPNGAHDDQADSAGGAFTGLTQGGGWSRGPST